MWLFHIAIHCKMITIINLINTSITSLVIIVGPVCGENIEIYSLSKFQVFLHNIVLLIIFTKRYSRSLGIMHLITENLVFLINSSSFSLLPASSNHHYTLLLWVWPFFKIPQVSEIVWYLHFCISLSMVFFKFIHVANIRISFSQGTLYSCVCMCGCTVFSWNIYPST